MPLLPGTRAKVTLSKEESGIIIVSASPRVDNKEGKKSIEQRTQLSESGQGIA